MCGLNGKKAAHKILHKYICDELYILKESLVNYVEGIVQVG